MTRRGLRAPSLRARAALIANRLVAGASRRAGLGAGSTVGGRAALLLEPRLLSHLGDGRASALVTGTNGKTTTTRLLAAATATLGPVATSTTGSNLPPGIVAALAADETSPYAVLEVDEAYLPTVAAALSPQVIVLLNLSRDQLDRVSEVRMVAKRWRDGLAGFDGVVVANGDDPLVAWAAAGAPKVRFVSAGGLWQADAFHCPSCGARLELAARRSEESARAPRPWSCSCGFARPEPFAALEDDELVIGDERFPVELALPGRFNRANAALAVVAAGVLGVDAATALSAMAGVDEVAGRFATVEVAGNPVRLLLAKNPAGWTELLELVRDHDAPAVVSINARIADGKDPSWLWDVPFELLAGRHVVATGERRRDLAVRLRHAGVEHEVADDALVALGALGRAADYIGNYTAFQDLRREIGRNKTAASVARPAPEAPTRRPAPPPARRVVRHGESALVIVVVHPELLGTYGDGGNGQILLDRAAWRDLPAELVLATSDEPLPLGGDLYLLGGGEDGPQAHSADVLADGRLATAVGRGAGVLAVCAGFQILGRSFPGGDGRARAGIGLLGVKTVRGAGIRAVGELLVEAAAPGPGERSRPSLLLTGFENHAGRTLRDEGVEPLGRVLAGSGNGDETDGARHGRVLGTYLHGPVLARNPALADELLQMATGTSLAPLDDEEEEALRGERLGAAPRRFRP